MMLDSRHRARVVKLGDANTAHRLGVWDGDLRSKPAKSLASGGIGRRARLRIWFLSEWGFESPLAHQLQSSVPCPQSFEATISLFAVCIPGCWSVGIGGIVAGVGEVFSSIFSQPLR
jgi:hypothetical protein